MTAMHLLAIGAGGFCGALLRHALARGLNPAPKDKVPWGTFCANLAACFVLGGATALTLPAWLYLFLVTGFLGSLSTFSTFIMEHRNLMHEDVPRSFAYLLVSVAAGLMVFWLGRYIMS